MIEGYWTKLSSEESTAISKQISEFSGEKFDIQTVEVRKFYARVYEDHTAYRVRFSKQRISSEFDNSRSKTVPEGGYCLVLLRDRPNGELDFISLKNEAAFLYSVNAALSFRVTQANIAAYLTFFGQVVHSNYGPFFMITDPAQISDVGSLTEPVVERLKNAVEVLVKLDEQSQYIINVQEKTYSILGRMFEVTIPVVHGGGVFFSTLRVSDDGFPEMTDDDSLTIQGLQELNPVRFYYHMDNSAGSVLRLQAAERSVTKAQRLISLPMKLEMFFGVLSLPIFVLFGMILVRFGASDPTIQGFFFKITDMTMLNFFCLLFGGVMVAASVVRFSVIEVLRLRSKLLPGRSSILFGQIRSQMRAIRKRSLLLFSIVITYDFIWVPIQGAVLFTYGFLNVFGNVGSSFSQSISVVFGSFPGLTSVGQYLFGISSVDFSNLPALASVISWGLAAFFGTIVFGIIARIFALGLLRV